MWIDTRHKMVAKATKMGSLYQFDHKPNHERASFAEKAHTKKDIWHKRFGHLGIGSLQKLVREKLADGFDFDATKELTFCESCPQGRVEPSFHQAAEGQRSLRTSCIVTCAEK